LFDCVHPYPCGFYGDSQKPCSCAAPVVTKYQKRIPGPLLDRIDIHIEVPRVDAVVLGYTHSPRSYLFGLWDEDENVHVPFVWITIPKDQRDVIVEEIELHNDDLPSLSVGGRTTEVRTTPDFVVEVEGDRLQESDKFSCGRRQTRKEWTLNAANIKQIRHDKGIKDITTFSTFLSLQTMAGQDK
jgi:ATP-dependent DNA ligase